MASLFGFMKKLFSWLLVFLPVLWVFHSVLWGKIPTWGDAPFFYPEGVKELLAEPLVWTQRGNNFGGVNQLLWLAPMMILLRFLSVKLVFYLSSLVLAGFGTFFLTRYLKLSKVTQFFSVLVFLLNTYYILLIDGGQAGVALAYGIFPFAILFGKRLIDKLSLNSFFVFIAIAFILTMTDPRVSVIAFIVLFIWQALENWRRLPILFLALLILIPLNFYWIYPLVKMTPVEVSGSLNVNFVNLLNSLLLFQPHWPGNVFGKISPPPFYFIFVPILIFGSLLFKPKKKLSLIFAFCFLLLALFATGLNNFAGRLPFGFALRDSSKFFIPLMLFGGILIGETLNAFFFRYKLKVILPAAYLFLLLLIWPALSGKLNFNLSNRRAGNDFEIIYGKLKDQPGFFRTLWFPEKHPLAFETLNKPALNARELVAKRPFAYLNASEDVFNFLNNPKFVDWFRVLGIKYLFLSGDTRNISPTEKDFKDWETITALIEKTPGLIKVDWRTSFPVYEVPSLLPKSYVVDKLIAIVGPELTSGTKSTTPAIYFEDGKWNPAQLNGKSENSLKILFNGKEKLDLTMSFLQKHFISPAESKNPQWIIYGQNEYLKAKYELLLREYKYQDFDYGKGIAFSTKEGEIINFRFKVPKDGDYVLAQRVGNKDKKNLFWKTEVKNFKKGVFEYKVSNKSGFEILNVVGLIPKDDFNKAVQSTNTFLKHFGTIDKAKSGDFDWQEVDLEKEGTLKYKFVRLQAGYWVIVSDSYSPEWKIKRGANYFEPVPVYSMVNGFYFEPDWGEGHIEYKGQEIFRWGIWVEGIAFCLLVLIYLGVKVK